MLSYQYGLPPFVQMRFEYPVVPVLIGATVAKAVGSEPFWFGEAHQKVHGKELRVKTWGVQIPETYRGVCDLFDRKLKQIAEVN